MLQGSTTLATTASYIHLDSSGSRQHARTFLGVSHLALATGRNRFRFLLLNPEMWRTKKSFRARRARTHSKGVPTHVHPAHTPLNHRSSPLSFPRARACVSLCVLQQHAKTLRSTVCVPPVPARGAGLGPHLPLHLRVRGTSVV